MPLLRCGFVVFCLLAAPLLRAVGADPVLKVVTPEKTVTFTPTEFAALPRQKLSTPDHYTQMPRNFSGVVVREILERCGLPFGNLMRGPAMQLAVVFRSSDGYGVVFALAEFDDLFSSRTLLLADPEERKPLDEKAAPFQLIVPGDKKGARWARMVTSIEVISLAPKL